jgi:general L-amino acid transport system permease protein
MTSDPSVTALPPPTERYTVLGWLHKNLFRTWYDSLLTIISLGLIYVIVMQFVNWLTTEADWEVVQVNLRLLMVGQYPQDQLWRIWLCLDVLATIVGLSWGIWVRRRAWLGIALLVVPFAVALWPGLGGIHRGELLALALIALAGFAIGRRSGLRARQVAVGLWVLYFPLVILIVHGLSLGAKVPGRAEQSLGRTVDLPAHRGGNTFSFPLGVLLALGRRSSCPSSAGQASRTSSHPRRPAGNHPVHGEHDGATIPPAASPSIVCWAMVGIVLFSAPT